MVFIILSLVSFVLQYYQFLDFIHLHRLWQIGYMALE